jgi:D-alanyl-D-alanine dipeptidase
VEDIVRVRFILGCFPLIASCATPQAQVSLSPATAFAEVGIVDVAQVVPGLMLDIRYAGTHNFVGEAIDGYGSHKCFLHEQAAAALRRVEIALRSDRLRLKVFDCYRPVRAVQHFVRWAGDLGDQSTKAEFYPNLDKRALLGEYIAPVSGHSRAATLDLTLMSCDSSGARCAELDMGTPFDFFDVRAHTDHPRLPDAQRANRDRLRNAMRREGFENYPAEWWHYTFKPEPSPQLMFDIPVR